MNRIEFLQALEALPAHYKLTLDTDGNVFCDGLKDPLGNRACAIVAVCHERTGRLFRVTQFHEAGELIGMGYVLRHLTISCLDTGKATPDAEYHRQLLDAASRNQRARELATAA